eukprot:UN10429
MYVLRCMNISYAICDNRVLLRLWVIYR